MAGENQAPDLSFMFERLMMSNRELPLFVPFIFGFTGSRNSSEEQNQENPQQPSDRIVLINPFTQGMMVIDGSSTLDSLLRGLADNINVKEGQPPASKASIDALPSVDLVEGNRDGECAICLEDWVVGDAVKEMPCKHRFHGNCVEKWLGIHGSCPVCRFMMPVDEEEVGKKGDEERRGSGDGEIRISFSFVMNDNRTDSDRIQTQNQSQTDSSDSTDDDSSSGSESNNEIQG